MSSAFDMPQSRTRERRVSLASIGGLLGTKNLFWARHRSTGICQLRRSDISRKKSAAKKWWNSIPLRLKEKDYSARVKLRETSYCTAGRVFSTPAHKRRTVEGTGLARVR